MQAKFVQKITNGFEYFGIDSSKTDYKTTPILMTNWLHLDLYNFLVRKILIINSLDYK